MWQVQELHCVRWQGLRPPLLLSLLNRCSTLLADLPPEQAEAVLRETHTAALEAGEPRVAGMAEVLRENLAMADALQVPPHPSEMGLPQAEAMQP